MSRSEVARLRVRASAALMCAALALPACSPRPVAGQLVEYGNDRPLAGATITVSQSGWGWSEGGLVWDKNYRSQTVTDASGRFSVDLPAPWLAGRTARVSADQTGYQRLVDVLARGGDSLLLQTIALPTYTLAGGIAIVGILDDGRRFGWSFIENRPTTDLSSADLYPEIVQAEPLELVLATSSGGLQFFSRGKQGIAARSYGDLLRYIEQAPQSGYAASLRLSAHTSGTIIVRTSANRYAKLSFDPEGLPTMQGAVAGIDDPVQFAVQLPFAYNAWPGRALAFDPTAVNMRLDPEHAAAAAELPDDGTIERSVRAYRLSVHDGSGQPVERANVRLVPETPMELRCPGFRYQYQNVTLDYGKDGLPRVRLSIQGPGFFHHGEQLVVSRRLPARATFYDYSDPGRPQLRQLQVIEIDGVTSNFHCG